MLSRIATALRLPRGLIALTVILERYYKLAVARLMYLLSYARKGPYVRRVRAGARTLEGARDVCVVVHFDRRGRVHDYLMYYLYQLYGYGFELIFVSNSDELDPADVARLQDISALIVERENVGYDFGAWKDGIALIPDLASVNRLLLVNDSVYGPFHNIEASLDRMAAEDADIWGMTDGWDFGFHLQSYFILFHAAALRSPAFAEFWSRVRYIQSKFEVVRRYEIGLTKAMGRGRLRCRALFPYRDCARALVQSVVEGGVLEKLDPVRQSFVQLVYKTIDAGRPLNATHFFWDYLIAKKQFPFIKRELLQRNPAAIPLLNYWESVVENNSDYDTSLIVEHLELTMNSRVV